MIIIVHEVESVPAYLVWLQFPHAYLTAATTSTGKHPSNSPHPLFLYY